MAKYRVVVMDSFRQVLADRVVDANDSGRAADIVLDDLARSDEKWLDVEVTEAE